MNSTPAPRLFLAFQGSEGHGFKSHLARLGGHPHQGSLGGFLFALHATPPWPPGQGSDQQNFNTKSV
jgi:hypothetical protein